MPRQLPLPLSNPPALGREDFIAHPANAEALALVDAYPVWPAPATALYGPEGSGKSHLTAIWSAAAGAEIVPADRLEPHLLVTRSAVPLAVEDVDSAPPTPARDAVLFALFERGTPLLLTGRTAPSLWPVQLPDLASRLKAMIAVPLGLADDTLLSHLTFKLFMDRQLVVPEAVVMRMISSLERSPAAIRDFVARVDARALAEHRAVNLALVRALLAELHGADAP